MRCVVLSPLFVLVVTRVVLSVTSSPTGLVELKKWDQNFLLLFQKKKPFKREKCVHQCMQCGRQPRIMRRGGTVSSIHTRIAQAALLRTFLLFLLPAIPRLSCPLSFDTVPVPPLIFQKVQKNAQYLYHNLCHIQWWRQGGMGLPPSRTKKICTPTKTPTLPYTKMLSDFPQSELDIDLCLKNFG